MKKRRSRSNSLPLMKKLAWGEFSKYIRMKDADSNGLAECITCGAKNHWKEMNAGHFRHGKLDFDEKNINVQCVRCNKWLSGNLGQYAIKIVKKYGVEAVDDLNQRADRAVYEKLSRLDLEAIFLKYKALNEKYRRT